MLISKELKILMLLILGIHISSLRNFQSLISSTRMNHGLFPLMALLEFSKYREFKLIVAPQLQMLSASSTLRRSDIFERSLSISRLSSTFVRRYPSKSSTLTSRGRHIDGIIACSRTYAGKLFLEGFILVQNTSRKLFRHPWL